MSSRGDLEAAHWEAYGIRSPTQCQVCWVAGGTSDHARPQTEITMDPDREEPRPSLARSKFTREPTLKKRQTPSQVRRRHGGGSILVTETAGQITTGTEQGYTGRLITAN